MVDYLSFLVGFRNLGSYKINNMKYCFLVVFSTLSAFCFAQDSCDCTITPFKPTVPCYKKCSSQYLSNSTEYDLKSVLGLNQALADKILNINKKHVVTSIDTASMQYDSNQVDFDTYAANLSQDNLQEIDTAFNKLTINQIAFFNRSLFYRNELMAHIIKFNKPHYYNPNDVAVSGCSIGGLPSIIFKNGSATLSVRQNQILDNIVLQLNANPSCKIKLVAYGTSDKRAQQLSWDHVNAIMKYLTEKQGISETRIIFTYGQEGDAKTVEIFPTTEDGPSSVPAPHPNLKKQ